MKLMATIPAPKYAGPVLELGDYTKTLAAPPVKAYWEYKILDGTWLMLGNDSVGDCEIARIGHLLMETSAHTGAEVVPTTDEILTVYSAISGYVPGDPSTDVGCNSQDVFNYWQNTGITVSGANHKLGAWVQAGNDQLSIEQCIWLFAAASLDIAVYSSMMDQFNAGKPWDDPTGTLEGYHAVPAMGYGRDGLTVITWGQRQQMGWPCVEQIIQANYAAITPEWLKDGVAPNSFDLATLQADLAAL